MAEKKPIVIVTRRLPEGIEREMRESFDARLNAGRSSKVRGVGAENRLVGLDDTSGTQRTSSISF